MTKKEMMSELAKFKTIVPKDKRPYLKKTKDYAGGLILKDALKIHKNIKRAIEMLYHSAWITVRRKIEKHPDNKIVWVIYPTIKYYRNVKNNSIHTTKDKATHVGIYMRFAIVRKEINVL